jgi:hypothetical protein
VRLELLDNLQLTLALFAVSMRRAFGETSSRTHLSGPPVQYQSPVRRYTPARAQIYGASSNAPARPAAFRSSWKSLVLSVLVLYDAASLTLQLRNDRRRERLCSYSCVDEETV